MIFPILAVSAVLTQPAAAPPAPTPPPAQPAAAPFDSSPPGVLGRRIAAVRASTTVAPVLVLVSSERDFNAAVARWNSDKGRVLYPILCDLNTQESRENIARFVRAFKPTRIVRFKAQNEQAPLAPLPAAPSEADLNATLYTTFGAKDEAGYLAALAQRTDSPGPLGAVVTQPGTPSCSAALALAAAYGQLLIFADAPAPDNSPSIFSTADKLSNAITAGLTALKAPYAGMGDQIDALTLCFNSAANVVAGKTDAPSGPVRELICKEGESLALTDVIGRSLNNNRQDRWAYASQLTGSLEQSTYRAMCAIFLQPTSAAAFNGYETTGEFGKYDPSEGLRALKAAGLRTGVIDRPSQSADDWRQWTSGSFATPGRYPMTAGPQPAGGALTSDLFLINTMGNRDFFLLKPGYCYAGDAPFLSLPAAVNFTHSWSLQFSGDLTTVGGRWLDRGAYCYVGSVHEPYLSAFVPQSLFAQRLTRGWPIAAAARVQSTDRPANPFATPWRITILGDALWTMGPALKRTTELPAFPGETELSAQLSTELKSRRYADAFDTLTMLGRDADAARLARAAIADEPEKIDRNAALRMVLIAYRAGDTATLVKAAQALDLSVEVGKGAGFNATVADAVWHALWPKISSLKAEEAQLLAKSVRPYSFSWDSIMATTALKRAVSEQVAQGFFDKQCAKAPDPESRKRLEDQRNTIFR